MISGIGASALGVSNQKTAGGSRSINTITFVIFLYFLIDFFLHLSARIPGYGVIRPTLLLVLIISLSLFFQREKVSGWSKDPVSSSVLVLIFYIFISLPLVEWPGSVIRNNLSEFVKAVVFFFFAALLIDSERRLKFFLFVFLGCQVIRVFEPLFLNITEGYWGSRTHLGHGEFSQRLAGAPSDVINPNELGFVIVTLIPFLHYLLWSNGFKYKLIYLVIMPPILYALILTQSRGAFLALLVIAFFIFKESNQKFRLILVAVVVSVLGWSSMSSDQKDRYLSLIGKSETSNAATVDGRLDGIVREFSLGLERPIVGHGLGTTPEAKTHILGRRQASHNLYAELLIELGIVGTIIFLLFLARIYKKLSFNRLNIESLSSDEFQFYRMLNKSMIAVFWMYVVYSLNYWGLSQYYWYLFGGLSLAFHNILSKNIVNEGPVAAVEPKYPLAQRFSRQVGK
ncbi:O-antigen ligase family protein [Marinobacter nauticus]